MKNIFDSNIALNGYEIAGKEFITKRTDGVVYHAIDENLEEVENRFFKQTDTRAYAVCFSLLCLLAIVLTVGSVVYLSVRGQWAQNWWWVIVSLVVPLFLAGISLLFAKKKIDRVYADKEYLQLKERYEFLENEALDQLEVPYSAIPVDVLAYYYEYDENGERVSVDNGAYYPLELLLYSDEENLYLADDAKVLTIPFSMITRVENRESTVYLARWNKQKSPSDKGMRELGVRVKRGKIAVNRVFVFTVKGEESFELLIPSYEIGAVLTLLAEDNGRASSVSGQKKEEAWQGNGEPSLQKADNQETESSVDGNSEQKQTHSVKERV